MKNIVGPNQFNIFIQTFFRRIVEAGFFMINKRNLRSEQAFKIILVIIEIENSKKRSFEKFFSKMFNL